MVCVGKPEYFVSHSSWCLTPPGISVFRSRAVDCLFGRNMVITATKHRRLVKLTMLPWRFKTTEAWRSSQSARSASLLR